MTVYGRKEKKMKGKTHDGESCFKKGPKLWNLFPSAST